MICFDHARQHIHCHFTHIFGIYLFPYIMTIQLFHADCFDVFPNTIEASSVDLVILDLPYNQTACKFDNNKIDLKKLWVELKRIGKRHDRSPTLSKLEPA